MNLKPFQRLHTALTVTLAFAFLVVFAGATVRATGSGMGCPDWPLCYGCLIPPISVDQLPEDYAQRYAVEGRPAEFNAVKTWIEYVNRLLGALTGLVLVITAGLSVFVLRQRPSVVVMVFASALVLAFVAWLGAKVVDTFLAPYAVTLHLLSAYALIGLLFGARELTGRALTGARAPVGRSGVVGLILVGLAFLWQWTLGIRTREEVEAWIWSHEMAPSLWESLGGAYDLHKVVGPLVLAASAFWAWQGWRRRQTDRRFWRLALVCLSLVVVQGALGLVLWLGELPSWAKPLHLVAATGAWSAWAVAVFHSLPSGVRRAL